MSAVRRPRGLFSVGHESAASPAIFIHIFNMRVPYVNPPPAAAEAKLIVQRAQEPSGVGCRQATAGTLRVYGLPWRATVQAITKCFEECGQVMEVQLSPLLWRWPGLWCARYSRTLRKQTRRTS